MDLAGEVIEHNLGSPVRGHWIWILVHTANAANRRADRHELPRPHRVLQERENALKQHQRANRVDIGMLFDVFHGGASQWTKSVRG